MEMEWCKEAARLHEQVATLTAERDEYKSLNEHHKEQFLKANLELAKVREELRERKDNFYQDAIEYRGVRFEDRCDYCGGTGVMSYASTATWHGGIGGQAITNDVCCYCWGSGDKYRPWTDLRKHQQQLTEAQKDRDEWRAAAQQFNGTYEHLQDAQKRLERELAQARFALDRIAHHGPMMMGMGDYRRAQQDMLDIITPIAKQALKERHDL